MIIAKTDMVLKAEDYDKWYSLYQTMIANGFLMVDGKFTLYNIDKNGKLEKVSDERRY